MQTVQKIHKAEKWKLGNFQTTIYLARVSQSCHWFERLGLASSDVSLSGGQLLRKQLEAYFQPCWKNLRCIENKTNDALQLFENTNTLRQCEPQLYFSDCFLEQSCILLCPLFVLFTNVWMKSQLSARRPYQAIGKPLWKRMCSSCLNRPSMAVHQVGSEGFQNCCVFAFFVDWKGFVAPTLVSRRWRSLSKMYISPGSSITEFVHEICLDYCSWAALGQTEKNRKELYYISVFFGI